MNSIFITRREPGSDEQRPITRKMRSLWAVSGTLPAAAIRRIMKRLWGR